MEEEFVMAVLAVIGFCNKELIPLSQDQNYCVFW